MGVDERTNKEAFSAVFKGHFKSRKNVFPPKKRIEN